MTEHLVIDNLFNLCSLLSNNWIRSLQNEKLRAESFRFGTSSQNAFPFEDGKDWKGDTSRTKNFVTQTACHA